MDNQPTPEANLSAQQGPPTQVQQFQQARKQANDLLFKYEAQIAQALPRFLTPERMIRVALTAMGRTPDLLLCTQASLISCILTCAQLGVLPDGILGEAYLIPFNNTKKGTKECTVIIGYRGFCALAMRSGMVKSIQARPVFEGDEFYFEFGLDERLKHVPKGETDQNKITHFYAVVNFNNGGRVFNVMTRKEVEAVRDDSANYKFSRYKNDTVWGKHFAEMGNKTVIRRLMKLVPLSPEINQAIGLDEASDLGKQKPQIDFMDDLPQEIAYSVAEEVLEDDKDSKAEELKLQQEGAAGKGTDAQQATLEMMEKKAGKK